MRTLSLSWSGARQGFITSGLNHVVNHFIKPRIQELGRDCTNSNTCLNSNKASWDHYFEGNGKSKQLGPVQRKTLRNSKNYKRVIRRLVNGIAKKKSSVFAAFLTLGKETFTVGRTNVIYKTTCTSTNCTTIFAEFVYDGFYDADVLNEYLSFDKINPFIPKDPKYIPDGLGPNLELEGGIPYLYIPTRAKIVYPNPGYGTGFIK